MRAVRFLAALAFLVAAHAEASAREAALEPGITYGDLSPAQKLGAIDGAIRQGRHDLARAFLEGTRFEGDEARVARFLAGGLLKAEGRLEEAEEIYRALLADHPDFRLVRSELAHTLLLMGRRDAARFHIDILSETALDADAREGFRRFIDTLDADKPFTAQLSISLAPSSNLNSGTGARTILIRGLPFTVADSSRKRSGVGLRVVGDAAYTGRMRAGGRTIRPYVGAGASVLQYEGREFDDTTVSVRGGARVPAGKGFVGTEGIATRRFFAGQPYESRLGGRLYGRAALAPALAFSVSAGAARRFRHRGDEDGEGLAYEADLRLDWSPRPGLRLSPLLAFDAETAPDRDFAAYRDYEGGLALYWEAPLGITAYAAARHALRRYGDDTPGFDRTREDRRTVLSLSLLRPQWNFRGWAPQASYSYTDNDSTIPFYDYDRHDVGLSLTRRF